MNDRFPGNCFCPGKEIRGSSMIYKIPLQNERRNHFSSCSTVNNVCRGGDDYQIDFGMTSVSFQGGVE